MENSINNQENQPQPPIDAVPTSTTLDGAPKKRNYLPWILGILILFIIFTTSFLVLIGKYKSIPTGSLIQPSVSPEQTTAAATTIDMSSWKTYKSEHYKYQFRYPADWDVSEIGGYGMGEGGYGSLLIQASYTQEDFEKQKQITMSPEKDYTFLQFIPDFPKTGSIPTTDNHIKVTKTNTIVVGKSAIIYNIEVVSISEVPSMFFGPIGHKFIHTYIDRGDSFFVIIYDDEHNSEIYDQILSTFKFLE